ncbi:chromosomal replication initiator protein DnaA [Acetanaerobacterium elongatum]|uniref:Chromosomal replication initiator protein DnaA n=1 Tax=Acetanaerobacterium elongatum TaxID=258515 RepID=A0A1H0DDX8_9FIRM|nr:chromosomal replication initiator protein DnaA [Acetanaerobacterium elongatum]SDN68206.1 chromosomal replication initiator protein [Acetanaerobacterium elongatum]
MESFDEVFQMVSDYCKNDLSETAHKIWIRCIEPVGFENNTATLYVKSDFQKKIIDQKYLRLIKQGFNEILGFEVDINLITDSDRNQNAPSSQAAQSLLPPDLGTASGAGEYEYTFETFIVGHGNKFAHAASVAVATKPSGAYNPLFIYGESGLGKTHLLYAILNEIRKSFSNKCIIYVKGEEFTNELIAAIQNKTTPDFHAKYRSADILLVDDIQFIGGKESTQEEFFHTFNSLYIAGKQIVLTSDRPPKEIKTLEDRLRTRFESGLLADIQAPDFETRIAIIRRKAELLDFDIPEDVAEYIANHLKNNIRQLEGAVKKLKAYKLLGSMPSLTMAQNAIRDILNDNQPVPVTVERIIGEVAKTYGIAASDIRSKKRSATISQARQVSVYIVREITQMPMTAIGEEFGGRDHSTIVYAIKEVESRMLKDKRYKETIDDILKNIRDS